MMTREEAIKWMEEAIQDTNTYWDSCSEALQKELNEQREVFLLAIDAILRADRKQKLEAENMELKERIINWRKYMVPTREQLDKVWRGEWVHPHWANSVHCMDCNRCGKEAYHRLFRGARDYYLFCPHCGAPMTDEAVEMVMKRMKELKDGKGD